MTEPTGEHLHSSPELGFAFGNVSLEDFLDALDVPELRQNSEMDDLSFILRTAGDFLREGPVRDIWYIFVDAERLAKEVKSQGVLGSELVQQYQNVASQTYAEHIEYVAGHVDDVNTFLATYPELLVRVDDGAALRAVGLQHIPRAEVQLRHSAAPARVFADWGGGVEEVTTAPKLYVNMAVLPNRYAKAVDRYSRDYEVAIDVMYTEDNESTSGT